MKTSETILLKLVDRPAPTESIADALRQPPAVIAAFCVDLETAGLATSAPLEHPGPCSKHACWTITAAGKAQIGRASCRERV